MTRGPVRVVGSQRHGSVWFAWKMEVALVQWACGPLPLSASLNLPSLSFYWLWTQMRRKMVRLPYRKALWKTFLDMLKKMRWLNSWQWLHNGPKHQGQVGLFSMLPLEKVKQEITYLTRQRLHMAATQIQEIQLTTLPDTYNDIDSKGQTLKWTNLHQGPGLLPAHRVPLCKWTKWTRASNHKEVSFPGWQGTQLGKQKCRQGFRPQVDPTALTSAWGTEHTTRRGGSYRHVLTKD